ncbi:MAG: ribonuclease III [Chlamydiae bacterium CG10_big_fil_rev_8_21_14_0_10_42_34]|nr:MAG: ribonuclease III [Chlamydiae bacterium CG10_big_fil_rev_8_21_14_0_10_42_34]
MKNPLEHLKSRLDEIEEKLGYVFDHKDFLVLAFIHRSFINEYREGPLQHNERLEFLGDSVLGLVIADHLYHRLPSHPEGQLSQLRSRLVDTTSCAQFLQKLQLQEYILLGKGETMTEGRTKPSILADTFEALLGALYLDGGLSTVRSFLLCHYEEDFEAAIGSPTRNYKAELQDISQKLYQKTPVYKVIEETGPDHSKIFHVVVYLDEIESGIGSGASKKEAEQKAAFDALAKRDV